jgi:hypothetical protein
MTIDFKNERIVGVRTNGFTRVTPGQSTIDGTVLSVESTHLGEEVSGARLHVQDRSGVVHQVDLYGPLGKDIQGRTADQPGSSINYVDRIESGLFGVGAMLHQEVVMLGDGNVGYKAPIGYSTPMSTVRNNGPHIKTEF